MRSPEGPGKRTLAWAVVKEGGLGAGALRDYGRRATASRCGLTPRSDGSVSTRRRNASRRSRDAGSAQRRAKSGICAPGPSIANTVHEREACRAHFFGELGRVVEEGGREVAGVPRVVAVLAVAKVALDDGRERRVVEERPAQAVDERGEARDRGRKDEAAGTQHA